MKTNSYSKMKEGESMKKPLLFVMLSFSLLLAACGNIEGSTSGTIFKDEIAEYIDTNYILQDVVTGQSGSNDISEIYLAENKSIDEVSKELQDHEKPREISEKVNNKQVLIYQDVFISLTLSEDNQDDTMVEISSYDFVRNNYHPNYFNGLFALWILDDILRDDNWANKRERKCSATNDDCYQGYGASGGTYKSSTSGSTSVRGSTSTVRGGGPGAGK